MVENQIDMSIDKKLIKEIKNKNAVIGIVGLGYVGLPLVLRYSQIGYKVIGIDIDVKKINNLLNGASYIEHISSNAINEALKNNFEPTADVSRSSECDALILCVPTPLNKYREPDLSYVTQTTDALVPHLRSGQIFSLESTTYPGTTEEELLPRVQSTGLILGENIFLVYSPEREDPGNKSFTTHTIPKVLGGHTEACTNVGVALYEHAIEKVVTVSSTKAAEMTKLLENIHRAVNIGLVNEMKVVSDKMGIDIHEVIHAAATKPFGFTAYYPGPGLGGHCIPIDPFYLTWKAREYGLNTRFIELAGEVNANMPAWVVSKTVDALNERGKSVKGSKVLILGIAYKKDVDDMRESPSVELMEILESKGALIEYSDPHVPVFPNMREHSFDLTSVELTATTLANFDVVVLATNHTAFDYELIANSSKAVIDTRGVYSNSPKDNIIKA